ncbi:hypothetical protein DAMA08_045570 [Martiniozyma asiatica (nom. inval.)]|nr:hypothetical protein DAMA08_045570 [Martiniozyma asiatica]
MSSSPSSSPCSSRPVVIVGAGIAGLAAASRLHASGIPVVVVESRDRIGGRIQAVHSAQTGTSYDLGACWYHSTDNNPLFDLVKQDQTQWVHDDANVQLIGNTPLDGLDMHAVTSLHGEMAEWIKSHYVKKDTTVKEAIADFFTATGNGSGYSESVKGWAVSLLRASCEIANGSSWEVIGACNAIGTPEGRDAFNLSTYAAVVDKLAQQLPSESIKLSTVVTGIDYNEEMVCVTTANGEVYNGSRCIVTVPFGVLKLEHKPEPTKGLPGAILFNPPLPKPVVDKLDKSKFVPLLKIILEFKEPRWDLNVDRWLVLPAPTAPTPAAAAPKSTMQHFTDYAALGHVDAFDYASLAVNLTKTKGLDHGALMLLLPAPFSQQVEAAPEDQQAEAAWEVALPIVRQLLGGSEPEMPSTIISTRWGMDPFARGVIPSQAPGDVPFGLELVQGFGRLRFAGESTVGGTARGCAHGAYISGLREADRIIAER